MIYLKLGELLQGVEYLTLSCDSETEISGIATHSDNVRKNGMFVAIKGQHGDGYEYIGAAIEKGAAVIVTDRETPNLSGAGYIRVLSTRKAWAQIEYNAAGRPADSINLIAVTGTNGKSSVTRILHSIIEAAGEKCGELGTLGGGLTTPDPGDLYPALAQMVKSGCTWAVMEASSHALALDKLAPISFTGAIFTNLTLDHTDFHGSMSAYGAAKAKLFSQTEVALYNYDDPGMSALSRYAVCPKFSYSTKSDRADFTAHKILCSFDGFDFDLLEYGNLFRISSSLIGAFQVQNSLAAAAMARLLGFEREAVKKGITALKYIDGRMMPLDIKGAKFRVFIDYAHTPDALKSALSAVRGCMTQGQRLVLIFGCGGERDQTKRAPMGKIASRMADLSIITADNSRGEDTYDIIRGILEGFDPSSPHLTIADRRQAIAYAVHTAREGDVLLFCGKGHENYEIDAAGRHPFSEREEILMAAAQRSDLQT